MAVKKLRVIMQNLAKQPQTPTKQQFQQWAQAALVTPAAVKEVTIRIVNAAESAILNKKFRQKTGPTNVLSFSYAPIPGEITASLGDIVICAELVKTEAETANQPLLAHWAHLTVHGLLHLQGYDHMESAAAQQMEQLETHILQELGFSNPYQDLE